MEPPVSDKILTWLAFCDLPTGTRLEVYIRGTGLWVSGRLFHAVSHSTVTPDDEVLEHEHKVVIPLSLPGDQRKARLLLVRYPRKPGYRVEAGPYRELLQNLSVGIVQLIRSSSTADGNTTAPTTIKAAMQHLLRSGGFTRDLWSVFKEHVTDLYSPAEDDVLARICADIEGGEKS